MSFEGEIGEIDLIERLVELGREGFTGAIRFENDGIIKIIYFKTGDILSASTNDRADSVDEILLRAGKVTREHVKQALAKRKESETLGDALLGLGFITRKELTWARRAQAIGILRSLRSWITGQYTIVADYLPKREEGTIFPLPQMLVELIVTEQDRARFERATDGGTAVFVKTPEFEDAFKRLGLNEDAAEIGAHVDGQSSASEVANLSGKDAFNVFKLLEALRVLGLIRRIEKPQVVNELPSFATGSDDFASIGVTDAEDAWDTSAPSISVPATAQFSYEDEEPVVAPELAGAPAPTPAPSYTWDEPAVNREISGAAPELDVPSSSWEDEPTLSTPMPTPSAAPLAAEAAEPGWGFDEAQIETARRASVPLRSTREEPAPQVKSVIDMADKPNRILMALIVAVVIIIVGVGGIFGYMWWKQKNQPAPAPVAAAPRPHPKLHPTVVTATTDTAVATATTTTGTTGTTTTTIAATATTGTSWRDRPAQTTAAVIPASAPVAPPSTSTTARLDRSITGSPMITNSASPSGAGDPLREKYDALAKQHAAASATAPPYTIQFELVCETASLTKALTAAGNSEKLWFAPLAYHGRSCYRVFWGHYANAAEARNAIGEMPAALRSGTTPVAVHTPQ